MDIVELVLGVQLVSTDHGLKRGYLEDDHAEVANCINVLSDIENIQDFEALDLSNLLLDHQGSCECCSSELDSNVAGEDNGKL